MEILRRGEWGGADERRGGQTLESGVVGPVGHVAVGAVQATVGPRRAEDLGRLEVAAGRHPRLAFHHQPHEALQARQHRHHLVVARPLHVHAVDLIPSRSQLNDNFIKTLPIVCAPQD